MTQSCEDVLQSLLEAQQSHELSIIKISEPISAAINHSSTTRTSDVSADAFETPSPASLEADLSHYKELFSKLRFSYLEQVTKEKFIRAIVGDPPLVVDHQENTALEHHLLATKTALQAQKSAVAALVADLEHRGRALARQYSAVQLQTTQLRALPAQIAGLQASIDDLRTAAAQDPSGPHSLNLPLQKSLSLLSEKERVHAALEAELQHLTAELLPQRTRELERLEAQVQPLEIRRLGSVAAAREARRRREEALGGDGGDDLEARGRWWRGVEGGLRGMVLGGEE